MADDAGALDEAERRVLNFYASVDGRDSDSMLGGPPLSAALLSRPAIAQLMLRGLLGAEDMQRRVLRGILGTEAREGLTEELWHRALVLVGSSELQVAQPAAEVVVRFATVERVQGDGTKASIERMESRGDDVIQARVDELSVLLALRGEEFWKSTLVSERVSRIVRGLEGEGGDPLGQLALLELASSHLVTKPWTLRLILESGVLGRMADSVKRGTADVFVAPSFVRLAASVALQGEVGFRVVIAAGWLGFVETTVNHAGEVPESHFDGALFILENAARGSADGAEAVLPFLESLLALVHEGEIYVRVRTCHCLASVLEFACTDGPLMSLVKAQRAEGLGARLLSLAQQPLLTEQRIAVFRLLRMLIIKALKWIHQSTPSLFYYCINRNLDNESEALQWRFSMAQSYLGQGNATGLEVLGQERFDLLLRFLREGVHGSSESKADVAKQSAN